MWPWPLAATVSIQKPRGFVDAGSKSVPAWLSVGVVARLAISYQRDPLRPPRVDATPLAFTSMLWAVQRFAAPVILFLWIEAENSRSSSASSLRFVAEPSTGCGIGKTVVGTVKRMLEEIVGTPSGLVIRRMSSWLKAMVSTLMKNPWLALGSSLE